MKALVVDASVAVKWFLPEIHSEAAGRVLKSRKALLAPDLLLPEIGNVLWKKVRRGELGIPEAQGILEDFIRFPIETQGSKGLLRAAWDLSARWGVTVYDGLYLALAVGRQCGIVTADRKLYESLKNKPAEFKLIWVEDPLI